VAAFVAALVLGPSTSFAFDDSAALQGMTEGKIAFDITDGGGKLLLKCLDIIDETRRSLIQQGVKPHFVIAFRGPATRLVQTGMDKIAPEDREATRAIAAKIEGMSKESGWTEWSNVRWSRTSKAPNQIRWCRPSKWSATASSRSWPIRQGAMPISDSE